MSDLTDLVRQKYAAVASSDAGSQQAGVRAVAEAFGYSAEDLARLPAEANMGLSCGNPTATASLRPGEVVVDLGCGGGLDVLLAAEKVGPAGRAIGIDMTEEMIQRAKASARRMGASNVEFHLASIDRLPLEDGSVDCVVSNCVINLAADKPAVFREAYRVLRPGGRLAVSDVALRKPLPAEVAGDVMAFVGCVAGAIPMGDYERGLREAGFAHVSVEDAGADLNAYALVEGQAGCCPPAMTSPTSLSLAKTGCCPSETTVHAGLADLTRRIDVNEYAASVRVFAVK